MILLMGLPGSGKGTQGKMLTDRRGMHLISMGDLVRMYVVGERRQRMLAGELLGDQEVIKLLDATLASFGDDSGVVLDGFPRTVAQADWLLKQAKTGRFDLDHVFYLKASQDAVKDRLHLRGRLDDRDDVIEERFREYDKLTLPVVDWLKDHGVDVTEINAEQTPDQVHAEIAQYINKG